MMIAVTTSLTTGSVLTVVSTSKIGMRDFLEEMRSKKMAYRSDGTWCQYCFDEYDDGNCYCEKKRSKKSRFSDSDKEKEYRTYAKNYGGSALIGSTRQKKWAEFLRYEILKQLPEKHAKSLCSFVELDYAKAWINLRNVEVIEISRHLNSLDSLVEKYKTDTTEQNKALYDNQLKEFLRLFSDVNNYYHRKMEREIK